MYLSQYISAGNTLRAAHTRYLLNDHLGSPMVVTDTHNHALQHLSFNAWGQRRYATWGDFLLRDPKLTVLLEALEQYALTRGFTGHEHDDEVGLIHMKGRLYDPQLGRFISADPFVQAPTNTQSYNRYSYVMNNPLSYTDPSGYFFSKLLGGIGSFVRRWGRTIVAVAASIFIPPPYGGFVSGLIQSGGDFKFAVKSAIFQTASQDLAAATKGFSKNVLKINSHWGQVVGDSIAHGVGQGTLSHLQGGKFSGGFTSSFVAHLTAQYVPDGYVSGTVVQAVIGGTVSKLVGDKFVNGAITASFTHMFNYYGNFENSGRTVAECNAGCQFLADIAFIFLDPSPAGEILVGGKVLSIFGIKLAGKPKLKRIHSDETLNSGSNKLALESQRTRSTEDIIESLKPSADEPLKTKRDGRIFDGNTRIKVLEERGVDVDNLPRTIID